MVAVREQMRSGDCGKFQVSVNSSKQTQPILCLTGQTQGQQVKLKVFSKRPFIFKHKYTFHTLLCLLLPFPHYKHNHFTSN